MEQNNAYEVTTMKQIIKPVSKKLLKSELKPEYFLRETNRAGNEIYVITAAQAPNVMSVSDLP